MCIRKKRRIDQVSNVGMGGEATKWSMEPDSPGYQADSNNSDLPDCRLTTGEIRNISSTQLRGSSKRRVEK